ncbi:MAG: biopolymer transporter ExbD [Phycisphaera sp.]|nr:MAG: biopolymer transporter ExbD [Phycisphaera sp.]
MAIRFRNKQPEPRLEMMPLLDVVFLLLTFFAFALMVMVRADTVDVELPVIDPTGNARQGPPPIVVSLADDGRFALNGEFIEQIAIPEAVNTAVADSPDSPVVLEIDVGSESGKLIELVQQLRSAGVEQFSILGNRREDQPVSE